MNCTLPGSSVHGIFQARIPGRGGGCHFVLQGIFPSQGSNLHLLHWRQILYRWAIREAPPDSGRHSINICKIELSCKNKAKISKHPQHQPRVHSIFLLVLTRCKLSFPDLNKDGLLQIPEMSKLVGLSSHLIHPCPQLHRMRYWGSRREKAIQSHAQEEWQSQSQASQIPGKLKMDK